MQSDGSQLAMTDGEWKDLLAAAVSQLKKVQDERNFYRTRYENLREDFQFNLTVLDERDQELARYDRLTAKAVTANQNRQKQQEHTRIEVGEHRAMQNKGKEKDIRTSQYRSHLNKIICCLTDEAHKLTSDHQRVKWDLQNQIHDLERQLSSQRQEMAAFQTELRHHRCNSNVKMDGMETLLSSQDVKVKLMHEKSKVCCQTRLQTTQDLEHLKQFCDSMQIQLQQKEQQMENVSSMKDSRIKDLEDKLKVKEMKMKEEEEKNIKKYQDVVNALKDSELQQEINCRAQSHRLQKTEKHIGKLQKTMEALHGTIMKKEKTIHWYEEQLSASLEREKNLEMMRAQMEVGFQRCCEKMKTEHERLNEQLYKALMQNKNQAKEKVKRKELGELTVVPPSAAVRDQAVQCLTPTEDPEKVGSLQQRSAEFQVTVSQMRKDIEALSVQSHVQSQLQEEKLLPRQRLSSGVISDDRFKYVQSRPVRRARLKHAVLCLTRLMKEKQQLIEMCNRLRGAMSSSGFKEKLQEQYDAVTNLEQRQLTSQEQQCRGGASHLTEQEEATAAEAANIPPPQETDRPAVTAESKNTCVTVSRNPLTQSEIKEIPSSGDPNLSQSIESLQSLWDLLDYGLSSSTLSEGEGKLSRSKPAESGVAEDQMMVCGITAPVHTQPPNKLLQKRKHCTAKKTTRTLKARPKIRNYNIKD